MDILDLSWCQSNEEVSRAVKERVLSVGIDFLLEKLKETSVFHEIATRKIYAALTTNNNAILYGPGGYGKSVLVKKICEILGLPIIYKVGYKGMMPDELFGVPDMKALMEESRYETAFENSVFSKPAILILEEGIDIAPDSMAALKDILTEKGFREKGSKKESLIASVIITGNKSPEDIISNTGDTSLEAFYLERFPFRHNMIWERFREEDYLAFFKVYYSKEILDVFVSELLLVARLCSGSSNTISPRVSSQAADVAITLGVDFLDVVSGLDTGLICDAKHQLNSELEFKREQALLTKIQEEVISCINKLRVCPLEKTLKYKNVLTTIQNKLKEVSFSDPSVEKVAEVNTLLLHGLQQIDNTLSAVPESEEISTNIDNLFKQ
jgi:hypothetical protein